MIHFTFVVVVSATGTGTGTVSSTLGRGSSRLTKSCLTLIFSGERGSTLTGGGSVAWGGLVSLTVMPTNPCVNQSAALLPAVTSLISLLGVAGVVGGALGTTVLEAGETSPIESTELL